jgi:hypothetical protein
MPNVPKLVGLSVSAAVTALQGVGMTLGHTTVAPSPTVQSGNVADVNPAEGSAVADGASVDLVISSGSSSLKELLAENYQSITFNVLAGLLLAFLAYQLSSGGGDFLKQLANQDTARGLITFLVTATAAALFIIMAVSTIVGSDGADADKRFDRGKQILTMLIGILGTIIGFYFGTASSSSQTSIKVSDMKVEPAQAARGGKFAISGTVSGGKGPYTYSIAFNPPLSFPAITDKKTTGKFSEDIAVPGDLANDQDVEYTIIVKDADGRSETFKGEKKISLKVSVAAIGTPAKK